MNPLEIYLTRSEEKPIWTYGGAGLLIALIAYLDWRLTEVSLGFLYVIPILMASATLRGWQILVLAVGCAWLRELFSSEHTTSGAGLRTSIGAGGFALAGFFVSQLNYQRHAIAHHLDEERRQSGRRADAEAQLRAVIDTSPLAIVTLNAEGRIVLANTSAQQLFGTKFHSNSTDRIDVYLPILRRFLNIKHLGTGLQTVVESRGQRADGEAFMAHIWLSTFSGGADSCLAAFIWDATENLRDREGTGLDSMLAASRVVIGMMSHEVRNLAAAAAVAYRELALPIGDSQGDRVRALGTVVDALGSIATSGLRLASRSTPAVADLGMVLDETRVLVDAAMHEVGAMVHWSLPERLPLVEADHHGLLQVFLNLARNSEVAIKDAPRRTLWVAAVWANETVLVRFRDSGPGVASPDDLFKPFQAGAHASGLGLYLSRAVLNSYGGDLSYESTSEGGCFVVQLWPADNSDFSDIQQ
jgi:signal transduction histidine kinase